jgi:cytochrome c-type biogenesis protein CcmF
MEDLYIVYLGTSDDGRALVQVYVNPLVTWVWIGTVVMFLGTLLTIVPEQRAARIETAAVPARLGLGRIGAET